MTVAEAKEYLRRAYTIDRQIDAKMLEAARLRSIAEKVTAAMISDGAQHTGGGKGGFERAALELNQLENEVAQDIERLVRVKREIGSTIKKVGGKEAALLSYRYLSFLSFEEISVRMSCTYRHITRLHGAALKKVSDVLKCP